MFLRFFITLCLVAVLGIDVPAQYHWVNTPRAFAVTSDGTFYRSTGIEMDDGKIASILRSTDKGLTWEIRARFDTTRWVAKLVALDMVLYGYREGKVVVESVDGGTTWTDFPPHPTEGFPGNRHYLGFGEPLKGHPLIVIYDDVVS